MALTESKIKDLEAKQFDKLFADYNDEWIEITEHAFNAARDHICNGRTPRQDDVLKMLLPMLEPNEKLRKHQEDHRARYKRFREAYAEFLIDGYFRRLEALESNERSTTA